jgi:hypothetical protein
MIYLWLAFSCTGSKSIPEGAIGDKLVITKGIYQVVPLNWDEIMDAGFIASPDCNDQMGQHAIWEVDGVAVTEFVFNLTGNLIGLEVISEGEEATPPWDMYGTGEPAGDNNTIHTFFSDNEIACELDNPEPIGLGDRVVMSWGEFSEMPLSIDDALSQGWVSTDTCVEKEGIYVYKDEMANENPWPVRLMYNAIGELIGIELSSWSEQVINPWSAPENEGDPWRYHMWFRSPEDACN